MVRAQNPLMINYQFSANTSVKVYIYKNRQIYDTSCSQILLKKSLTNAYKGTGDQRLSATRIAAVDI